MSHFCVWIHWPDLDLQLAAALLSLICIFKPTPNVLNWLFVQDFNCNLAIMASFDRMFDYIKLLLVHIIIYSIQY